MNINDLVNLVIQPIGLACAILVLFSIIGLGIINKRIASSLTVRLIAALAVADILAHIGEIYASANEWLEPGSQLCAVVNGFRVFSRTFYNFINIAICFHLYRSLVLLKKSTLRIELYTWIVTVVMVIIFTFMYWSFGAFIGKENKFVCIPGADSETMNKTFRLMMGITDLITCLVGLFTTIASHRNLNKYINVFSATLTGQGDDQALLVMERRKMAVRSFLYPLSACITLPIQAIFLIFAAFGTFLIQLTIAKNVTLGLSGLLTGIAFAIDPSTHSAFRSAYYRINNRYHMKKDLEDRQLKCQNDIPLNAVH
ncbi:hypothetical protein CONCODRAFT_3261 [Conidiobolus coronatus NRRL 28638]|uniref:G-protein coupled receptors family 1 profile domain-containing protein n=1 Tax=Conidiobolus coronatus (strain ATCC 28846 / CBS 209.66 / NRRL 28638) TaxID=796925 RepID=A0A137PFF9_CONC2|nr:hypothetical protein CONCODRAFT_3261 [Conidiobolus coronatus NRRL 28638]|eukprot:KXN73705.1 hypothetical protein CONCODRAFT_3261 [Conidiobolus coronatus NRRL 28638]